MMSLPMVALCILAICLATSTREGRQEMAGVFRRWRPYTWSAAAITCGLVTVLYLIGHIAGP